jgi:hypothetical protein
MTKKEELIFFDTVQVCKYFLTVSLKKIEIKTKHWENPMNNML